MARVVIQSGKFTLATGVNTDRTTEGANVLVGVGTLRQVTVNLGNLNQGVYAEIAVIHHGVAVILKSGTIRGPSPFGEGGGLFWQGEIPVDRNSILTIGGRNDSGASIGYIFSWVLET